MERVTCPSIAFSGVMSETFFGGGGGAIFAMKVILISKCITNQQMLQSIVISVKLEFP